MTPKTSCRRWRRRCLRPKTCIFFTICCAAVVALFYKLATFCVTERQPGRETHWPAVRHQDNRGGNDMYRHEEVQKVLHEFSGFRQGSLKDIENIVIPNTVHYVWCHNRTIEFTHYLSILSIWKILQPDVTEFHHRYLQLETDKYNTWYSELKARIPGFVAKDLPKHWDGEEKGCGPWFGIAVVDDRGGVFVSEETLLTEAIIPLLKEEFSVLFTNSEGKSANIALLMAKSHHEDLRTFKRKFSSSEYTTNGRNFCQTVDIEKSSVNSTVPCLKFNNAIQPRDIFTVKSDVADFARTLLYGSAEPRIPGHFLPGTIPKVVHYVWFGTKEMDFFMYLSVISTLFIVKPEKVLIHWDGGLHGRYFDLILKDKRVTTVYREKPFYIFGHRVLYSQHRSDIVRAEALIKYGGIYIDWDVLWLKSPDDLIATGYDAIVNFDHMPSASFPETINLGVFMAKPRSTFVKRWQDALSNYRSEDFLYNAVELPYKIYEKYPDTVYIERRLQVMCFHLKCHPTFKENFKDFSKAQDFDWRTDAYAIHFTYPDPTEYKSEEALRNGTGMFADIGMHVLRHANKL